MSNELAVFAVRVHNRLTGNSEPLGTVEAASQRDADRIAAHAFAKTAWERHGKRGDLLVERVRSKPSEPGTQPSTRIPTEQKRWLDARKLPPDFHTRSVQINVVPEVEVGLQEIAESLNPRNDIRLRNFHKRRGRLILNPFHERDKV